MKLKIEQNIHIAATPQKVYNGIILPEQMSNYFISESTGVMKEGETLTWKFPEFDLTFPVRIGKMEENKYISFRWDDFDGTETLVEIRITEKKPGLSFIEITESGREDNEAGITWLGRNSGGWGNFLASLKAWLEHGINLRKNAFSADQFPELK
jgi:uncharacterized protein YndB with AHSA1/START domain